VSNYIDGRPGLDFTLPLATSPIFRDDFAREGRILLQAQYIPVLVDKDAHLIDLQTIALRACRSDGR
jgi:hypothetical protein